MLGDTTEKSKNPLKKAMRRRNAKTVTFGGLNYVEASDYEYSSDEEEDLEKVYMNGEQSPVEESDGGAVQAATDDDIAVAPLSISAVKKDMLSASPEKKDSVEESVEEEQRRPGVDQDRASDELFNRQFESQGPKKTRNGNIRNTDSFFKDETVETRKITLTPNLLRDDSNSIAVKLDTKSRGGSFEAIDREVQKAKEDKKKKEKKSGMLSGMFKRNKDKKSKRSDGGSESPQKGSEELSRDSPGIISEEASPVEKTSVDNTPPGLTVQRKVSNGKLQKSRPGPQSPTSAAQKDGLRPLLLESDTNALADSQSTTPLAGSPERPSPVENTPASKPSLQVKTSEGASNMLSDIASKMRSPSDSARPEKVKKAKTREALDVDSSPDVEKKSSPFPDSIRAQPRGESARLEDESKERLSESPVHITSADAQPDNEPPALVGDNSSSSSTDELTSLRSSPSPPIMAAPAQTTTVTSNPIPGSRSKQRQIHSLQAVPYHRLPLSRRSLLASLLRHNPSYLSRRHPTARRLRNQEHRHHRLSSQRPATKLQHLRRFETTARPPPLRRSTRRGQMRICVTISTRLAPRRSAICCSLSTIRLEWYQWARNTSSCVTFSLKSAARSVIWAWNSTVCSQAG